jgi:hypothetical protein
LIPHQGDLSKGWGFFKVKAGLGYPETSSRGAGDVSDGKEDE